MEISKGAIDSSLSLLRFAIAQKSYELRNGVIRIGSVNLIATDDLAMRRGVGEIRAKVIDDGTKIIPSGSPVGCVALCKRCVVDKSISG